MKAATFPLTFLLVALTQSPLVAQAPEDPAHQELRDLRTAIIEAIKEGDITKALEHVAPEVVVTWQNNEVVRGRRQLEEYFNRMGREAFKGYVVPPTPDDLTTLYGGDTGVSTGRVVADYHVLGKQFRFESRWTATLVKRDGRWQLAGYHLSINPLDNPVLDMAKGWLLTSGLVGVLIGVIAGVVVSRMRKRA